MKRFLLLTLSCGLLAACTDRLPTALETERKDRLEAPALASAVLVPQADALTSIEDALERIVPTLSNANAARPVHVALEGVGSALLNADAEALPALLGAASDAVDRYARSGLDEVDLDVIRLALDYAGGAAARGR